MEQNKLSERALETTCASARNYRFVFKARCLLTILLLAAISVDAANKYVRKGATGNGSGSDWANAYSELSSVSYSGLPGFTLYIAAGSYTTGFPTMSGVANATIKRATLADHGTDTGWSASYDGQVTVTPGGKFLYMSGCNNVVVDGGGKKEPWLFRVVGQRAYNGMFEINGGSGITVRYLELDGNGCQPNEVNGPEDGLRIGGPSNITIEHNWIHNYWYCTGSGNVGHSDGIQMPSCNGATIRYNKFQDSGMLLFFGDCAWGNQWANNVWVHHNIFIQQNAQLASNEDNYRIQDMKGVNQTSSSYLIIENNTYYRASGFGGATIYENTDCPGNTTRRVIRNNIFYNGSFGMSSGNGSVGNNCFYTGSTMSGANNITSNPLFVDAANFNFRLQSGSPAKDAGAGYAPLYGLSTVTLDYDGNPVSGSWYMGAFEYGASSTNPVVSVSPSSLSFGSVVTNTSRDLSFTVQNSGGGTLSGTASVTAPFSIVTGGTYSLTAGQSQTVTVRYSPVVAGSSSLNVTFTGGGGATAAVTGVATTVSANSPPTVSPISQNATDIDPTLPGIQVFEGTVVQYSGSASDSNGDPLTWQWIYTVNGGAEVVYRSGSGTVTALTFSYGAGTAGSTFVWKLRVNDGQAAAESQLTVGLQSPPLPTTGLVFEAEAGTLTAPFVVTGGYVYQASETGVATGGRAAFNFTITNAGDYVIQAVVNAPDAARNSFFVNIDAEPQDPGMIWQIPVTAGFESRIVNAQGTGTFDDPQFVPKFFNLTTGPHQLIVRGREANTQLDRLAILKAPTPPQNLRAGP